MNTKEWNATLESWGFEFVNDYAPRHVKNNNGKEVSVMSFEDDDYEVAWINHNNEIQEKCGSGIETLKGIIESIDVNGRYIP